ncbi:hypothetical protein A1Q1_03124 [Trichosporon asahii var. asahii CBS 2479]|uniref:Uncharacterized protein n=1 Tax=Trichosporon asahii var. asahii (strain ATCC 90039 / CBS 2479 / JCM 2466 / KCTC 7840 / NBRC 103889/ NCYC 2677 / UAMH 7654) TaxID=1186058 RepID=J4UL56_TRIAS|nr:hypothetical protein A1Q1_03124 [Trichosporon asahii var. asahii CBS 2479]EJT52670.1 hypothetical protein A1Q1_03124 [Trichosporon asahii var. asahii CBS 2479]
MYDGNRRRWQFNNNRKTAIDTLVSNCLFLRRADKSPLRDAGALTWNTAVINGRKRSYQREASLSDENRPHVSWGWVEYARPRRAGKFIGLSHAADGRSAATVTALRYPDASARDGTVQVSRYEVHIALNSLKEYYTWLLNYEYLLQTRTEVRDTRRTAEVRERVIEIQKQVEKMAGKSHPPAELTVAAICAFLALITDWEERWKVSKDNPEPPIWTSWEGRVIPDISQSDEKFAARLDDLIEHTKVTRRAAHTPLAGPSKTRLGKTSSEKEKADLDPAPEPLSDYALRLVHHIVHEGMPPLPAPLIVWPYYREFYEGIVTTEWLEDIESMVWGADQVKTLDLGHAEVKQCGWGRLLRYGRHLFGGRCDVVKVRFGPGLSPGAVEGDGEGRKDVPSAESVGGITLELSQVINVFTSLERTVDDTHRCAQIQAYADAHPGVLDMAHLTELAEAHNARARGYLRALYYTLRYIHIHKDDLPSLPPWEPWMGKGDDVLNDRHADPKCFSDLITDGRLSEYGFHLAQRAIDKGWPRQPDALIHAANKAASWSAAQARAKRCRHCKHQRHTVSSGGDLSRAGPSSGVGYTPTQTAYHDMTWSIDVYPSCSHSATERGESSSGGGGGGGGGSSGGGDSGFSGGGGGSSSFDSGGFSSSF